MTDDGFVEASEEEIAVLLLDTQGTFDSESSMKECVIIFALGTMLSSTLIFNLSQNIQEDDLQHLQFFTEYGRLAMKETNDKPFQTLLFLVRDWPNPQEHQYGLSGGREFLQQKLEKSGKHKDLEDVRKGIKECFADLECFLMPHPGMEVATGRTGKLAGMDNDFKKHLSEFVPHVSSANNVRVKKIGGREVTCGELLEYLTSYVEAFHGDELPTASTLVQTTAVAHHLADLERVKSLFAAKLREECGADKPYLSLDELESKLADIRREVIQEFNNKPKIGGSTIRETYLEKLESYMGEMTEECIRGNDNKANFLVRIATGISYIAWPVTTQASFQKVQRWFIRGAVNLTSFFRHPLDGMGKLGNSVWSVVANTAVPTLPDQNPFRKGISAILSRFHAPIVLLLTMIIANMFSHCFGMVGLSQLSVYASFVILSGFILLCVWLFSFFTGKAAIMRAGIDLAADYVWNQFTADPEPDNTTSGAPSAQTTSAQTTSAQDTSTAPDTQGSRREGTARTRQRRRPSVDRN